MPAAARRKRSFVAVFVEGISHILGTSYIYKKFWNGTQAVPYKKFSAVPEGTAEVFYWGLAEIGLCVVAIDSGGLGKFCHGIGVLGLIGAVCADGVAQHA